MDEEDKEVSLRGLMEHLEGSREPFTFGFTFQEDMEYFLCETHEEMVLFLMARLIPETRAPIKEEHECDLKTDVSELTERLKDSAIALWSQTQIRDLQKLPQYQLFFSEWLTAELCVRRSQDALTDTERQEYEHWVCEQYYLPMPVCEGGGGGDVTRICADIITAVLDQHSLQVLFDELL
ncbi:Fanconi anemia group A protein [Triplophysa rosa]|uniref:Fanconi anemia group A protein n=1 Tax=Triplophysa rosa TaxID=992332 RepID=A0A9W7T431_TRIRA|nr:Fanconi anemia group A protein [Triplophysa rosa]